jgi:hypothetical protein
VGFAAPKKAGGYPMIKKQRLGPDSPLVQEALAGIYKSGRKIFFKINADGHHEKLSVTNALGVLPITYENKVALIRAFPFRELAFSSERMKNSAAANAKKIAKQIGDENEDEDIVEAPIPKNCRYHFIQQGDYFGAYDGLDGGLVLFKTQAEAKEYIHNLLHHREGFKIFYGGKSNDQHQY